MPVVEAVELPDIQCLAGDKCIHTGALYVVNTISLERQITPIGYTSFDFDEEDGSAYMCKDDDVDTASWIHECGLMRTSVFVAPDQSHWLVRYMPNGNRSQCRLDDAVKAHIPHSLSL